MLTPIVLKFDSFQIAWLNAVRLLERNHWEYWNLIVQIDDPLNFNQTFHNSVDQFASVNEMLKPKDVCYTIFPFGQYITKGARNSFYSGYINKFYPRTQKSLHNWGTYFYRMINYERDDNVINQLENIINAINKRKYMSKAAYNIIIEKPGSETIRPLGAPCLNYLAVQLGTENNKLGLLAVYRNHDFLNKVYGNYWGLCKLLCFIADETGYEPGSLTCVSSHAYVPKNKQNLSLFIRNL